jgi:hypothetical protein
MQNRNQYSIDFYIDGKYDIEQTHFLVETDKNIIISNLQGGNIFKKKAKNMLYNSTYQNILLNSKRYGFDIW